MRRSVLKIICIVSGILFVLFSVFTVYSVIAGLNRVNASGGIIGGAGAPTLGFVLRQVAGSAVFYAAVAALALFVGTGLVLIFSKKPKQETGQ